MIGQGERGTDVDRLGRTGFPLGWIPRCRSILRSLVGRVSVMFRRPRRDWSIDPPAGTGDRPALPISELDPIAWNALVARASQLPIQHVHSPLDFMVLCTEELRSALRIGRALDVDDDSSRWHSDTAIMSTRSSWPSSVLCTRSADQQQDQESTFAR